MTAIRRQDLFTRTYVRAVAATLFLLFQPARLMAGPVTGGEDGVFRPSLQSPAENTPGYGKRNDHEAIVPPLPQNGALTPAAPNLSRLSPSSSDLPEWHLPVISQRDYLSGGSAISAASQTGSLPLDPGNPFDVTALIRQSAEFSAIRYLLDPDSDARKTAGDSSSSTGWTDQPIRANALGGGGTTQYRDDLGLQYFATAVESLGVTDSQRQLVQKAVLDLKKYISVAQPNSQDMILQSQSGQRQVTISFNQGQTQYQNNPKGFSDVTFDDPPPMAVDGSDDAAAEYVQLFSLSNIWQFMTSSTMIVLYILLLALWAAWRYAIRRYI